MGRGWAQQWWRADNALSPGRRVICSLVIRLVCFMGALLSIADAVVIVQGWLQTALQNSLCIGDTSLAEAAVFQSLVR